MREGSDNLDFDGVQNSGEPIRIEDAPDFAGFSAGAALPGEVVKVWTRLSLTSDMPLFHQVVESLAGTIAHMTKPEPKSIKSGEYVLFIIRDDHTAELWIDSAAVCLLCCVKRSMKAGEPIFENDIADIRAMTFPKVEFRNTDKVFCLFRVDWKFAFHFDANPEGNLDMNIFYENLGALYRQLRYEHLYKAIQPDFFPNLVKAGWFPFAEIIGSEFKKLLDHRRADFDMEQVEAELVEKFDSERLSRILERWLSKQHFASRSKIFEAALTAFESREPITVLKLILTEIEGVLNEAYREAHDGRGAKLNQLLNFAKEAGEKTAGSPDTLLLPDAFVSYMRDYTFAQYDGREGMGLASTRHAVGHGGASQDSYTMARALQAILSLDQIAFYT